MLFCRCGCVTKLCSLCLAGSLETKLKSVNFIKVSIKVSILFQFYSRVSEVTLSLFLVSFGYVLGTKLDAVSLLRMRHKAMQLVLGRLAGYKTEKFQIYGFQKWRLGFFCYVLGTKLGAVLPLRMRHKGMQLVLGRCAGHKTERSQFYRSLKLKVNCAWRARWPQDWKASINFSRRVSEVTLGLFWCTFARFWARN